MNRSSFVPLFKQAIAAASLCSVLSFVHVVQCMDHPSPLSGRHWPLPSWLWLPFCDCIEHYAVCTVQLESASRVLRLNVDDMSLARFLALDPVFEEEADLWACHVYTTKRVVDAIRHGRVLCNPGCSISLFKEGYKTASVYSSKLASRIKGRWVQES